jgi:hypothetical protein
MPSGSLQRVGLTLRDIIPECKISRQKLCQAEAVSMVRSRREMQDQNPGFASRPFVLCGLPVKRTQKSFFGGECGAGFPFAGGSKPRRHGSVVRCRRACIARAVRDGRLPEICRW